MIDLDLRAHLLADAGISATVGSCVYALRLPQDASGNCIVYDIGNGFSQPQVGSMETVLSHTVTLSVYSSSYATMRTLSDQVTTYLNGMNGQMGTSNVTGSSVVSAINYYEEEPQLYRNIIILNIYTN